jgi:hypothetical protein
VIGYDYAQTGQGRPPSVILCDFDLPNPTARVVQVFSPMPRTLEVFLVGPHSEIYLWFVTSGSLELGPPEHEFLKQDKNYGMVFAKPAMSVREPSVELI